MCLKCHLLPQETHRLLSQNNMAPGKVKAFRLSCLCELTLLVLDIAAAMNKPVDTLYSCLIEGR